MKPDIVEIKLTSKEVFSDRTDEISLRLTAYLTGDEHTDKHTLELKCNPLGKNYKSTFLRATFKDWTPVIKIHDFLSYHFSNRPESRRTLKIPVEDGEFALIPYEGTASESDDLNTIIVTADGTNIEFGGMAVMTPYIRTYEVKKEGTPQDDNNSEKLLSFFNEITSEYPITRNSQYLEDTEQDMSRETHRLFNQYAVSAQLNTIAEPGDQIYQDYQKAVDEFKDQEYRDAVRDLGTAIEDLVKRLCDDIYEEEDIPNSVGEGISKLDKTENGLPAYIGKSVSPAWWLRNKASHVEEYEISKADTHYALLCFQIAVETYVEDFLEADVDY